MPKTGVLIVVLVLALLSAANAHSQGFGVYEQSACASGRGGATVASPCGDASSIYFNPAGIVLTPGSIVSVGATIIAPRGHFTDGTTGQVSALNIHYYPVPNVYYKMNFMGDRAAAGIGVFAPYGLETDWPTNSEGRFVGYKSVVTAIYIQPTVAYKINDMVSVGGGIDITRTSVELRQRLDLYPVPAIGTITFGQLGVPRGTDFADVQLKGDAWHAGVNLGVIVKPHKLVSLGVRYLSGQRVDVSNGNVNYTQIPTHLTLPNGLPVDTALAPLFAPNGRLSDQGATTSIPLPDQVILGAAVQVTPKLMALVDYQFVRWSMFDALVINQAIAGTQNTLEQYGNTSGVRIGAEYALSDLTSVRAGADFHGAAAPPQTVTPNLPEGSRAEFSVGVGHKFGAGRVDAYYMYLHQGDRAGRTVGSASGVAPTTSLNNGTYAFMSNLFGVTLAFGF